MAQSEDLAQEAFVIAWKQLPALHEPDKLRTWLCGIVRNLGRRAQRAKAGPGNAGAHSIRFELRNPDFTARAQPVPLQEPVPQAPPRPPSRPARP